MKKNENVDVVIRPEDLEITTVENGMIAGIITSVTFKGVHYEIMVQDGDMEWMIHSTIMRPVGTEIGMKVIPENIHIMKKVVEE